MGIPAPLAVLEATNRFYMRPDGIVPATTFRGFCF